MLSEHIRYNPHNSSADFGIMKTLKRLWFRLAGEAHINSISVYLLIGMRACFCIEINGVYVTCACCKNKLIRFRNTGRLIKGS